MPWTRVAEPIARGGEGGTPAEEGMAQDPNGVFQHPPLQLSELKTSCRQTPGEINSRRQGKVLSTVLERGPQRWIKALGRERVAP